MTLATMSDAHREWHTNSGVPMGQPGCPMDACHPVEQDYEEPTVRCGNHGFRSHVYHYSTEDVRRCFASGSKAPKVQEAQSSVWHSTGLTAAEGHWEPSCPGATCPVVALTSPPVQSAKPDRISVEEMQSWKKIPVGKGDTAYYALLAAATGEVSFFRVRRPSKGKYAGRTYVDQQSGDNFMRMEFRPSAQVMSAIAKNPMAAAVLYGRRIERCAMCHRSLTDDVSRGKDGLTSLERGIGPTCAKKHGLV